MVIENFSICMADMAQESVALIAIIVISFVAIKMTPHVVIVALHNPVIMIISIFALLWLTTQSPKMGVLGLLLIGGLYLERNRRTLYRANEMDYSSGAPLNADPTMPRSPSQFIPRFNRPMTDNYDYDPVDATDEFAPVDSSINHKAPPLTTVPPGYATIKYL
jgi:hypothetical protein